MAAYSTCLLKSVLNSVLLTAMVRSGRHQPQQTTSHRHCIPANMTLHVEDPPAYGSLTQHVAQQALQALATYAQLAGLFQAALAVSALPGGHRHTMPAVGLPPHGNAGQNWQDNYLPVCATAVSPFCPAGELTCACKPCGWRAPLPCTCYTPQNDGQLCHTRTAINNF